MNILNTPPSAKEHPFVNSRLAEWAYWITEREAMRRLRQKHVPAIMGWPAKFSSDPVMAGTRWCNVRRMDDKVSKWLMVNWFPAEQQAYDLLQHGPGQLAACLMAARMINKPETLSHITGGNLFSHFDYDTWKKRMYEVKASGETVFTNAYIINGASGGPKIDQVLNAIKQASDRAGGAARLKRLTHSMRETAAWYTQFPGVGLFIAGQIVADSRWVLPACLWEDRMSWAPPGPGSSRGMKYLLGYASAGEMVGRGKDLSESQFLAYLPALVGVAQHYPGVAEVFAERKLEAHDIQNTLCELSKYVRVKNGGHAKNKYPPKQKG